VPKCLQSGGDPRAVQHCSEHEKRHPTEQLADDERLTAANSVNEGARDGMLGRSYMDISKGLPNAIGDRISDVHLSIGCGCSRLRRSMGVL